MSLIVTQECPGEMSVTKLCSVSGEAEQWGCRHPPHPGELRQMLGMALPRKGSQKSRVSA